MVAGDEGVVGILTESDLFPVLLRLLGGGEPSSRITLVLPDVPGALGRRVTVVGDLGVNLLTVVADPGPARTRGVVCGPARSTPPRWWPPWSPPASPPPGRPARPGRPVSGACAVAADERLAAYDFEPDQPFQAGRLATGLELLRAAGVLDDGDLLAFGPAADADLELVHDRDYLEALARFSGRGGRGRPGRGGPFGLAEDNRPFPGMDEAARLVAGATVAALDASPAASWRMFAPVAGLHHAQRRRAVGFCVVNDVAVAIARCTRAWPPCGCCTSTWTPTTATACRPPSTTTMVSARSACTRPAATCLGPARCTSWAARRVGRSVNLPGAADRRRRPRPPRRGGQYWPPSRPDVLVTQNGCDGHADDASATSF